MLVQAEDLRKLFPVGGLFFGTKKFARAVDGVCLEIARGEALGLVGESGSGKSTLGRLILRLIEPTAGSVHFDGRNVLTLSQSELKEFRKKAQIVFQNPYLSLNPSLKVIDTLSEPILVHGLVRTKSEAKEKVVDLLDLVGLGEELLDRYAHELSGGQMQRVAIARALSLEPEFIVFDEPTSSLDVSAQAQILNIIKDLKGKLDLTYLFISHNLAVVNHVSDRVAVMYAGKIVEIANTEEFYADPKQPYSQILLNSIATPDAKASGKRRTIPKGEPPSPLKPPPGCRFHTRCPFVMPVCSQKEPPLASISRTRQVACFLYPEATIAA